MSLTVFIRVFDDPSFKLHKQHEASEPMKGVLTESTAHIRTQTQTHKVTPAKQRAQICFFALQDVRPFVTEQSTFYCLSDIQTDWNGLIWQNKLLL